MATTYTPLAQTYLGTPIAVSTGETTDDTAPNPLHIVACAIIGPCRPYKSDGSLANYPKGVLVVLGEYNDGIARTLINAFDLETGNRTANPALDLLTGGGVGGDESVLMYSGISPMGRGIPGYYVWHGEGSEAALFSARNGLYDNFGTPLYNILGCAISGLIPAVKDSKIICDVSPLSRTKEVMALVAKGNCDAGSSQLHEIRVRPDIKLFPTWAYDTPDEIWNQNYASGAQPASIWGGSGSTTWATRPDSCLDAQNLCNLPEVSMALLGDWVADPTVHKAITNPRLALIYTVTGGIAVAGPIGGARAHGMVCDQHGFIYVVGTGGLTGVNDNLIEQYMATDLSTPLAQVTHAGEGEGLGGDYAAAADTHIYCPLWDGARLLVFDHGTQYTRLFIYGADLVEITHFTISTAAQVAVNGPRWRAGKYSLGWWSENY